MRKGFSVRVFNGEIESFCRFQEGLFDNVMVENESFLIAMEGVILNKKSLCQEFASTNFKDLVLNLFIQKKQRFFALLEGEFSGFIIDKSEKTVFAFTNVTSTQKVFYYRSKDLIIIDTSIKNIVEDLKSNKIPFSIDVESIYQMLAFTNIIENKTPIKDIFKIYDASYIKVDAENLSIKEEQYFNVEAERFSGSKEEAIDTIDEIFSKSVALEYEKDHELDKEIALGAEKWVDINRFSTIQNCIDDLKNKGYQIIATTPHNDSCLLDAFDITKKSAIFFGTEKLGLSEEVMQQADGFLKIPMVGFTESLNISVSAAIVIQDLTNRIRKSSIEWQLTEEEIIDKRLDWTRKSIKDIAYIESRYYESNP
jgi:tRNA(Leu) C34 or U34 (ribose-2'-O)-methylase TrmL